MLCPKFRPKYLMYYQPTMWVKNASASLLHFPMRSQSLAKFINKMHFEMNNPCVDFGVFLFKIAESRHSDACTYILTVKTEVYIRGNHFVNTHDLDVISPQNGHGLSHIITIRSILTFIMIHINSIGTKS